MSLTEHRMKPLNLLIIGRILTAEPWLSEGGEHAYANFLKRTLGKCFGKLHATSCEDLTI